MSSIPVSLWDSDDWEPYKQQIEEAQELLVELGTVKLLCKIISHSKSRLIYEEAFQVAIALVLGGNYKSQQKFQEYIVENDPQNDFINKIFTLLGEYYDFIKKNQARRNTRTFKRMAFEKTAIELKE